MSATAVNNRLFHKLNPTRFPRMTNLMAAIIGHLLDIRFVNPAIAEIAITSDGFVLARAEGDTRTNFIGEYSDLARNWFGLLAAAGLTTAERIEADALFAGKIGYFGRTSA